ncbi:MAG TPA: trypsin-like peptidase domain-containing protein [Kofleriaceae bacterium]|nr:trypsin-like peptidase domain-containing protein [Kofleriaceae bacterium]
MTDGKKPRGKRRRKTPVAGTPEAAEPLLPVEAQPGRAASEPPQPDEPSGAERAEPAGAPAADVAEPGSPPVAEALDEHASPASVDAAASERAARLAASAGSAEDAGPSTAVISDHAPSPEQPASPSPVAAAEQAVPAGEAPGERETRAPGVLEPSRAGAAGDERAPAAAEPTVTEPGAGQPAPMPEPVMTGLAASGSAMSEPATAAPDPATAQAVEPQAAAPDVAARDAQSPGAASPDVPPTGAAGARPEGAEPPERRVYDRRAADRRAAAAAAVPVVVDEDGWPLESAEATPPPEGAAGAAAPAAAPSPAAALPQMPSPAAAAYEAARIVGEMVGDIESVPGAALVAAAAAGAAIEVARARVAAGEPERSAPSPGSPPTADAASTDPVITVRMQRDRILRALAEDIAANATSTAAGSSAAPISDRAGGAPGPFAPSARAEPAGAPGRAASQPSGDAATADDAFDDELDPVAIAAAAIARLRERARSDLAELRVQYQRHDLFVLLAAFVIIVIAARFHDGIVTPPTQRFEPGIERGLTFEHFRGWLLTENGPLPAPRIAHEVAPSSGKPPATLYHAELTSTVDPSARIEVLIDKKPAWSNIVTGLDLDRRTRWGELYALDDSAVRSIEDHQWLRTAYRFAHAADKGDVPRIDHAVEYATIDREHIYVMTFFGTPAAIERIEDVVAPTLRVATQTGLPLVPQTGHLSARKYPNAVARAFESTVMVVVADVVDGRLHARGGGSGVIVGRDGSILTNYHVIHDQRGRLHDVFVIGRFSEQDKAPQLFCAGKPSRSKLQREIDLALLKCDLDLDGRSWSPTGGSVTWPTLPQARTADIKMGQRIWVLGYPDVGGGGLTLSEGDALGWSGVEGAAGNDFLKTDAAIRHGNSGGPVVDDAGRLVGIASAVRTKQNASGDIVEVVQAGGRVRPIAAASDLLAIAAAGWTPREGQTDVELQPSAIEAPTEGVQIQTHVLDVANEAPIRDALVMVLRPGINAGTVDVNRLDDQVLSYGRSNAQGEVLLRQPVPVPGTYTVMVIARGYEPVIDEGELILDASTPPVFDPWRKLLLRAR